MSTYIVMKYLFQILMISSQSVIYYDVQGVGHSYKGVEYLVSMEQGYILLIGYWKMRGLTALIV